MQTMINHIFTSNRMVKHMASPFLWITMKISHFVLASRSLSTTGVSAGQRSKDKDTEAASTTSTRRVLHKFQYSDVLQSEISKRSQCGLKVRRSIVATDRFYPLVRVKETITLDPTTGEEEVVDAFAVVADHIQVRLRPGASESDLRSLNEKLGGRLRRNLYTNGMYLISFSNPDVHTVTSALIAYNRESAVVQYAEPDFILRVQSLL